MIPSTPVAPAGPSGVAGGAGGRLRRACVVIHRWVGLTLAAFLTLAGLTGSLIAFNHELDRWLNPDILRVEPSPGVLSPEDWIKAAEMAYPSGRVSFVTVPRDADEPAALYLEPRRDPSTGKPLALNVDQVFVHPATGRVLGARARDGFRMDRLRLIPFIYTLHYSLHLGQWGTWIFGVVALLWMFDCFVGAYLTFPPLDRRPARSFPGRIAHWLARWRPSWLLRVGTFFRAVFTFHRAAGLWLWIVLFVLAFSGMSMNLHKEVFEPAVNFFSPMTPWPGEREADRKDPAAPFSLSIEDAITKGREALDRQGAQAELGSLWFDYAKGYYHLGYHTADDLMREHPGTWVSLSGINGSVVAVRRPGGNTAGDVIHDWQFPLHSGKAFGLPGRILISITGLCVAALSVTGVILWWRKRRACRRATNQSQVDAIRRKASQAEGVPLI